MTTWRDPRELPAGHLRRLQRRKAEAIRVEREQRAAARDVEREKQAKRSKRKGKQ